MRRACILFVVVMTFGFADVFAEPPQNQNNAIIVYYFHRTVRCPSCTLLEMLTNDAIEDGFARELKNGQLMMKTINVDEETNEHFVDDYGLEKQSVILSQVEAGKQTRWKNLDRIWTLLEDPEQLLDYIQKETRTFLEGIPE